MRDERKEGRKEKAYSSSAGVSEREGRKEGRGPPLFCTRGGSEREMRVQDIKEEER